MTYPHDSSITPDHARRILESLGRADEFVPGQDYYLSWDADRAEFLTGGGWDEPVAQNTGTMSWLSI